MQTETVNRTVVCRTESSRRKRDRLRPLIEEWQDAAEYMAAMAQSFDEHQWGSQSTTGYRVLSREFDEADNYMGNLMEAQQTVFESFESWLSNGKPGSPPVGDFGDGSYIRLRGDHVFITENDRGYGLKAKVEPYTDPLWLHLDTEPYHESYFKRVIDGGAKIGASELRLDEKRNEIDAHIVVSEDLEVMEPGEVDAVVGVDLGESVLYAAAPVFEDGTVSDVEMETGDEFRHHRERISSKYDRLQEAGKLHKLRRLQDEREQYTDHRTHVASKRIVELADEHDALIALESLTGYRNRTDGAIHDWPFAEIQRKIAYKASSRCVPVVTVDPAYTSQTCRQCGTTDGSFRDGDGFECGECGYEVHADVNAAINIGKRAWNRKV